jgi:hypothetical protein
MRIFGLWRATSHQNTPDGSFTGRHSRHTINC